jgi:hypothetical protein
MRRSDLPDGHFHLTAAGAGGTHIYVDDLDRLEFLHALGIATTRFGWRLVAYCLMGTHYHRWSRPKRPAWRPPCSG